MTILVRSRIGNVIELSFVQRILNYSDIPLSVVLTIVRVLSLLLDVLEDFVIDVDEKSEDHQVVEADHTAVCSEQFRNGVCVFGCGLHNYNKAVSCTQFNRSDNNILS